MSQGGAAVGLLKRGKGTLETSSKGLVLVELPLLIDPLAASLRGKLIIQEMCA